ncbi:FAD-dependent oxidoreductase [Roseomonas alkaliterrae]|uniref:NADPH-dependent 2,4-dienoyl-CoA reductase/sulfur reductase-like enzyme n=1 Tax=Neoroseomonas alkaliterrae TaxID=1452450 RepID=A0A840XW44_9PROT|nr:NAD(P)/FAD-dependent oxidoreductase [Neoroseomonas alkaliterrae]MBB5690849.1 NADPH-dependent 2,4-dienoyl-CoA reductase/sulfur reductase-like enzyme [Neoroseomonas alkaliterrae]MBR0677862.1 FAD-dependent oxidoreductase [Neoroseomonas alkaliterrae]
MTNPVPRRALLAAAALLAAPAPLRAQPSLRLVVIGGGFGGASAASFARRNHPDVQVTLVEPQRAFVTCPYGNLLLGGERRIGQITHSYDGLRARGVTVIHDRAAGVDAAARRVRLAGGQSLSYDRLILSPGIALRWGAIEGYDEAAAGLMPHAWVPGDGSQTLLLRRQLEAMPDGGVVGLAIPANPFRCPPGPYERISMIAHYLKRHKPRSKILALDAKEGFSKQGLFQDGWRALYGDMIEWVPGNRDGKVVRVDVRERVLETEFGTRHKVDVANIIPPQSAAAIAREAGLANDTGWVPVDTRSFEARAAAGIHVIGDANIPGPMPKSGYIASTTARQAVASAIALHRGQNPPEAVYFNTCYSHVGEEYGISVVGIFRPNADGTAIVEVPNSGGVSPRGDLPAQRRLEALHADAWYDSITGYMFG